MPDLDKQFHKAMLDLHRRITTEAKYPAPEFFRMLTDRQGVATAKALITKATPSTGFTSLWEKGRLDLTVEAEVMSNPKWFPLFTAEELRKARIRLDQHDYRPETLVVFTFKSIQTCIEVGGTQSWDLKRDRANACNYVVLTRNAKHEKVEGDEEHRSAFLIGHISGVIPSDETDDRWLVQFDSYAKVDLHVGGSNHNPVSYSNLKDLGIKLEELEFHPMPGQEGKPAKTIAPPSGYWIFICNPKKWAIDKFLQRSIAFDTWGVRKADAAKFAPGQLAIVRVGVDRRPLKKLDGAKPLVPGVYAICEVTSVAEPGTGAADDFWGEGQAREAGWPTVKIRYLRTFANNPLTLDRLRSISPNMSTYLLDGFQASSMPLSEEDFLTVLDALNLDLDDLPMEGDTGNAASIAALSKKYANAAPTTIERLSRQIERGPVGAEVKKANGHRCQICEKLGRPGIGFKKPDGTPYVEAHHVVHVATQADGVLAPSNVITVCPNHHRELHYGPVSVKDLGPAFEIRTAEGLTIVSKFGASET